MPGAPDIAGPVPAISGTVIPTKQNPQNVKTQKSQPVQQLALNTRRPLTHLFEPEPSLTSESQYKKPVSNSKGAIIVSGIFPWPGAPDIAGPVPAISGTVITTTQTPQNVKTHKFQPVQQLALNTRRPLMHLFEPEPSLTSESQYKKPVSNSKGAIIVSGIFPWPGAPDIAGPVPAISGTVITTKRTPQNVKTQKFQPVQQLALNTRRPLTQLFEAAPSLTSESQHKKPVSNLIEVSRFGGFSMPTQNQTRDSNESTTQQPRNFFTRTLPWAKSLLAILAGNTLYYAFQPHLSEFWQHKLFQIDAGLGLDFILCAAMYIVVRAIFG